MKPRILLLAIVAAALGAGVYLLLPDDSLLLPDSSVCQETATVACTNAGSPTDPAGNGSEDNSTNRSNGAPGGSGRESDSSQGDPEADSTGKTDKPNIENRPGASGESMPDDSDDGESGSDASGDGEKKPADLTGLEVIERDKREMAERRANPDEFEVTLEGEVVNSFGDRIPGAVVTLDPKQAQPGAGSTRRDLKDRFDPLSMQVTTDIRGAFKFKLSGKIARRGDVSCDLQASSEGYAPSKPLTVRTPNGAAKTGIRIVLRHAGRVAGRVVTADGEGVANVSVRLIISRSREFTPYEYWATSGSDGQYRFDDVLLRPYRLRAVSCGVTNKSLELDFSEATQLAVDIVVRKVSAIRVKLLTATGELFRKSAKFKVLAPGIKEGQRSLFLRRARDGSYYRNLVEAGEYRVGSYYRILVEAGEYRVVIEASGCIPSYELPVQVKEGEIFELGEIRVFPDPD